MLGKWTFPWVSIRTQQTPVCRCWRSTDVRTEHTFSTRQGHLPRAPCLPPVLCLSWAGKARGPPLCCLGFFFYKLLIILGFFLGSIAMISSPNLFFSLGGKWAASSHLNKKTKQNISLNHMFGVKKSLPVVILLESGLSLKNFRLQC